MGEHCASGSVRVPPLNLTYGEIVVLDYILTGIEDRGFDDDDFESLKSKVDETHRRALQADSEH